MTFQERKIPAIPVMKTEEDKKAVRETLYAKMRDRLYGEMPPAPKRVEGKRIMQDAEAAGRKKKK